MIILGFKKRLYKIRYKEMVSDGKVFYRWGFRSTSNPIKDKFKLYIKR